MRVTMVDSQGVMSWDLWIVTVIPRHLASLCSIIPTTAIMLNIRAMPNKR